MKEKLEAVNSAHEQNILLKKKICTEAENGRGVFFFFMHRYLVITTFYLVISI